MLVLSRLVNETVIIGGGISGLPMVQVTVVEVRGAKVRIGFEAPKEVPVHRKEVFDAIARNAKESKDGAA